MRKGILSISLIAFIVFGWAPSAYPKGSPDLIVITGGGLVQPIELTDREILKRFDPWGGQFINWTRGLVLDEPDRDQSYEVSFYMIRKGRSSSYDRGNLKMIYALRYCPGRDGKPGYIYLATKGDGWGSVNPGTIIREGHDGKWHYASAAWDDLMKHRTSIK